MIGRHVELLGCKVRDKVTKFKGVVTSVAFDLYGCVQVVIQPGVRKDGSVGDGRWVDIGRVDVLSENRVIDIPNFDNGYIAEGKKGPADKSVPE